MARTDIGDTRRTLPDAAKGAAALAALSGQFQTWLLRDVEKLEAAYERLKAEGPTADAAGQLYMRAHDLKSLGTTCEFPVVTRLARDLCELVDDDTYPLESQVGLIGDHVDAIRIVVANGVRTEAEPAAQRLIEELQRDLENR